MGSGLIFLVIVGAWLAVLVPTGLRAHGGTPLSTDPEPEAGDGSEEARVLPRRHRPSYAGSADGDDVAPGDSPTVELHLDDLERDPPSRSVRAARRLAAAVAGTGRVAARGAARTAAALRTSAARVADRLRGRRAAWRATSAVERRRRVLVGLLAACASALTLGVVAAPVLLLVAAVLAAAAALHLVGCRYAARRDSGHARRRPAATLAPSAAERPTPRHPVALSADTAVRAPAAHRVVAATPGTAAGPAPAASAPAASAPAAPAAAAAPAPLAVVPPLPAPHPPSRVRGALGEPWQPVPVPLPLYLARPASRTSRAAPQRSSTADLRGPVSSVDRAPSARRRASGDW